MKNQRVPTITTATELRALLDERRPYAQAVKDAFMRGDLKACEAAQKAMREKFN